MRLSRLLKLSFVGTLLFSPAMAQETSSVHEEALRVLRSGTNQPAAAPAAPASAASRRNESPAERNARLKAEAQQRLAERERQQAEKRRQFEEYVKERERLRSGAAPGSVQDQAVKALREQTATPAATPAPAATAPAAPAAAPTRPAPAVQPQPAPAAPTTRPATPPTAPQAANPEVQQRALDIVREQRQPAAAPAAPVRESELAPRTLATPSQASRSKVEDTHQKALEVLRQQNSQSAPAAIQSAPATTSVQPAPVQEKELKPSPELQRRLDEMNRELNTPAPRSNAQADDAYTRELQQRALESAQQQRRSAPATATVAPAAPARSAAPATATTAPANDAARTREMLRRQDEQLRRQSTGLADSTPAARPAATPAPARSNAADPAAEARAREILRQQQQAVSNASSATAATERSTTPQQPAVRSTPPPAHASSASTDVEYSKDLENRARQALLERQQPQQAPATAQQAQAQAAATAASTGDLNAPLTPNPEVEKVHARAMETLTQVQPGEGGQTRLKNKQERINALTELYRADRLTPAEYHQRRAAILAEPNK